MVNCSKKFSDIAFQHETGLGIIFASFPYELPQSRNSFMRSLANATGKRIRNESRLKNRIENCKNGVMQYSVSNLRLVNVSLFGVADMK